MTLEQMEHHLSQTRYTEKCIICGAEAKCFTGHVLKEDQEVIAGFCTEDHANELHPDGFGCFGKWKEEYGLQKREEYRLRVK